MKLHANLWIYIYICITAYLFPLTLEAQVTIGANQAPEDFSILEISTRDVKGGLRLPQLETGDRIGLNLEGLSDAQKKSNARGLAIYNTQTKCIEFWNSEEWISLCSGKESGKVSFSNCDLIKVVGVYDLDKTLEQQEVRIDVPVNVKKLGTYTYTANFPYNSDVNVTFVGTGTFVNLGPTVVSLYVDVSGASPAASVVSGVYDATVTINEVESSSNTISVECQNVKVSFLKRSSSTLKIINIAGDQNNTGLTSSGGNYTANSVYRKVGQWLAEGSTTVGSLAVPQSPLYYSGTLNIVIVDVPYNSMATLQNNLANASIVWAGASEKYSYGFAQLIKEWNKAGKGIVITTGDKVAESTVSDALGYYVEDGSAAYGTTYCSNLPQVFASANGAPFNLVGINDGISIGRSGSNCGYVLSNNGIVFMRVGSGSYPSAFADIDNDVFIFGDKFGAIDVISYNSTEWLNYAKVLIDVFAWSLKNAPIYF